MEALKSYGKFYITRPNDILDLKVLTGNKHLANINLLRYGHMYVLQKYWIGTLNFAEKISFWFIRAY
jgi:hypothetical protein